MTEERKYRRRHYFIKKDYQTKFILKFCLLVLAGLIVSTALLLLLSYGTVTTYFEHGRLIVRNTSIAIMPALFLTNALTLILVVLSTIAVVLFISHKIAGPLFRFEKELVKIGQGDLCVNVHLRKNDQFKNMAVNLNQMTASLNEKMRGISRKVDHLGDIAQAQSASESLKEEISDLKQTIDESFIL